MNYFFVKPNINSLSVEIMERGWDLDKTEVAFVPVVLNATYAVKGGTTWSSCISAPVISLLHGNEVLPLDVNSPVMNAVGWLVEAYCNLPPALDVAKAPVIADRDTASVIVSISYLTNRHVAAERVELAAHAYATDKSDSNWQALLKAEWERFQLEDAFVALPCDETTFQAIFAENASLKQPLSFLATYIHYWQSKQANLNGERPSDFAIGVIERCLRAGASRGSKSDVAGEIIRMLDLHPLHKNLFHSYVAELVADVAKQS